MAPNSKPAVQLPGASPHEASSLMSSFNETTFGNTISINNHSDHHLAPPSTHDANDLILPLAAANDSESFGRQYFSYYHTERLLREERTKRNFFMLYIFAIIVYLGLNIALFCANLQPYHIIEHNYSLAMHLPEFWGVFVFSLLEALILISTKNIDNKLQSAFVTFNVCAAFVFATLFTIDPDIFDTVVHECEYGLQVLLTLANFLFITSDPANPLYKYRRIELTIGVLVFLLSLFQVLLYNGAFPFARTADQEEHYSHSIEYATESFNAVYAVLYAIAIFYMYDRQVNHLETQLAQIEQGTSSDHSDQSVACLSAPTHV